jgi:hypothetical protein
MCSGWKDIPGMNHKKCGGGRVFIDRVFSNELRLELFCLRCGKRWFIRTAKGAFGPWLSRLEKLNLSQ